MRFKLEIDSCRACVRTSVVLLAFAQILVVPEPSEAALDRAETGWSGFDLSLEAQNSLVRFGEWYVVETATADAQNTAMTADPGQPIALAVGQIDGDGVLDLVVGHAGDGGGTLVVHRGNPDFLYSRAAKRRVVEAGGEMIPPYLGNTAAISSSLSPDFVVIGDMDADGRMDVVVAERGRRMLELFSGDGQGGLAEGRLVVLPGRLSALVGGEVNRRDGLADLAVAVEGAHGSQLLVFEAPEGAFARPPEVFPLPGPATEVVFGQFDGSWERDVAVLCGEEVIVICGRDRALSRSSRVRARVPQPRVEILKLDGPADSMAVGDFVGDPRHELALIGDDGGLHLRSLRTDEQELLRGVARVPLVAKGAGGLRLAPARLSGSRHDDLVLLEVADGLTHLLAADRVSEGDDLGGGWFFLGTMAGPSRPSLIQPERLDFDAFDDLLVLFEGETTPALLVRSTAATYLVNSTAGSSDDGTCDSSHCSLREAIDAANASPGADTINFSVAEVAVTGQLPVIDDPVVIDGTRGTPPFTFRTSVTGTPIEANGIIVASGADGSTLTALAVNGFRQAIDIRTSGNHVVSNCLVGLDASGDALGNTQDGISISDSAGNTVGGSAVSSRNYIGANGTGTSSYAGVRIHTVGDPALASGNEVLGNYIGTNLYGTGAIGNDYGVDIYRGADNHIGLFLSGNLISGNIKDGVYINQGDANWVGDNLIGTTASGTAALANERGVAITGNDNTVGPTHAVHNVISGNIGAGVRLAGDDNVVQANYIGTDINGTTAVANGTGVETSNGDDNAIGGTTSGAGNLISGNTVAGVNVSSVCYRTDVQGNLIGTDPNGASALPNGIGVTTSTSPYDSLIGGAEAPAGNTISGNTSHGVELAGNAQSTQIRGNRIGTAVDGISVLGNGGAGVMMTEVGSGRVGGTVSGYPNIIAHNAGGGVVAEVSNSFRVTGNRIFGNGGLGIDLGDDGVTLNDPGDGDTGPNKLQNFPVLDGFVAGPSSISVTGSLDSIANTNFDLEFFSTPTCDASGYGEGATYLGAAQVTTNASGLATFDVVLPVTVAEGHMVTATATDPVNSILGATSEFSECVGADMSSLIFEDDFESGNTGAWSSAQP